MKKETPRQNLFCMADNQWLMITNHFVYMYKIRFLIVERKQ